ncbi:GDSL esterase/lipase At5g22810-like [Vicia villosa]|uniref:GDSL esterase/lipase At5g22810-like n=1 Tax=Vicia villosa TaxID=3911 RepID=UPI00273B6A24|nr:GDSL esterase/lipase At5g22810-like [Vicia villosa]
MNYLSSLFTSLVLFIVLLYVVKGKPLVPALFIFGDSLVDVGNNNNLPTAIKANFLPYGRDFVNHYPSGRFSNGKLTIDFASELFGFNSYTPAYLNLITKGDDNLLNGANFASSATGYHYSTVAQYNALSLSKQLEFYKDYQKELEKIVGQSNASSIISGSVYFVVAGSGDFVQNYFISPILRTIYTPDQFSDILIQCYFKFIQNLYALGARKIGVSTLPPVGCVPIIITLFDSQNNQCVEKLNNIAIEFNKKLILTSENLLKKLPGLRLVLLDIYTPLYELVTRPSHYGFFEARRACCGAGWLEVGPLCNSFSIGTCANASEYVFWDSFHATQATYKFLIESLNSSITSLI